MLRSEYGYCSIHGLRIEARQLLFEVGGGGGGAFLVL